MLLHRMNSGTPAVHASRNAFRIFACSMLCWSSALGAQTEPDSMAVRLRRAEAAIAVLQQQLGEQAEGAVQSRSRARLVLSGRAVVNAFGNSRKVNNVDNPQFVLPDPAPGVPMRGAGMSVRHTRLALEVSNLPRVLGGAVSGDMDVDFHGGQHPSAGGRTFPLLRLRTLRAFVRWDHSELLIGQESPLISGLNPVSPAAVGTPGFTAAGNLWLWLPQVRFAVASNGPVRAGVQTAVLAPTSGDPQGTFETDNDAAERAMRPFLQARVFGAWGEGSGAGEVGCGVHRGWLVPVAQRETSSALACDAVLAMAGWLEVRAEAFTGQALRGLGGGGIGQNFTSATAPLDTRGGWAQVNLRPWPALRLGVGCGGDHPASGPVRQRNDACAAYTTLGGDGPMFVGVEHRRLRTGYAAGRYTNDHVTLAAGFEF